MSLSLVLMIIGVMTDNGATHKWRRHWELLLHVLLPPRKHSSELERQLRELEQELGRFAAKRDKDKKND